MSNNTNSSPLTVVAPAITSQFKLDISVTELVGAFMAERRHKYTGIIQESRSAVTKLQTERTSTDREAEKSILDDCTKHANGLKKLLQDRAKIDSELFGEKVEYKIEVGNKSWTAHLNKEDGDESDFAPKIQYQAKITALVESNRNCSVPSIAPWQTVVPSAKSVSLKSKVSDLEKLIDEQISIGAQANKEMNDPNIRDEYTSEIAQKQLRTHEHGSAILELMSECAIAVNEREASRRTVPLTTLALTHSSSSSSSSRNTSTGSEKSKQKKAKTKTAK